MREYSGKITMITNRYSVTFDVTARANSLPVAVHRAVEKAIAIFRKNRLHTRQTIISVSATIDRKGKVTDGSSYSVNGDERV